MWKNWRKFFPDFKNIKHSSSFRGLEKYFRHSYLWDLDRECVARGVAIGLFIGIIPILPFQTVLALCLCIFLRGNFAIAFLASWISNPITIVPLTYLTYCLGDAILGKNNGSYTVHDYQLDFSSLHQFWLSFNNWIYQFGKGFFIGLPILSIGTAFVGYFLVNIIWHIVNFYKGQKKRKGKKQL